MSKEDTTPGSPGLLSKVVKFVRNPATSWSDLDNKESDRDEALSKQLLKEMIERKRRNDFVRKREFDMLRKMRKREAMVGQDPGARPSFFQSSMPSKPDDRAMTLKKIDEIEAQMSMQWWKTKQGVSSTDSVGSSSYPGSRTSEQTLPPGYLPTQQGGLQQAAAGGSERRAAPVQRAVPEQPAMAPRSAIFSNPNAGAAAPVLGGLAGYGGSYDSGVSGFSQSKLSAIDVGEVAHDAELEEAAIRFANGDDAGAEAGLLEMLGPDGKRANHFETWMTLFDLYRATSQQEKFEHAAIQFVQRFDRSAPQWFSMPDLVKQMTVPGAVTGGNRPVADWVCPSVLGIQTVAALKAALARAPMPWRLDWTNLKSIEAGAVEALFRVFSGWSAQPVQLRFIGDARLEAVLQEATPSGRRDTPQDWWQLRMEMLRVTHHPDEFELAALDFCVTYEVSPPAWESARCEYKQMDNLGGAIAGQTIIGDVYRDSSPSSLSAMEGDTQMDVMGSQMGQLMTVELSGTIEGDAIGVLETLEARLMGADIMMISCANLVRVDFSAAGTLLNWVSEREAENRAVQFSDANRLVAAFFNVIGITEHAKVLIRID
ncbi:MAG: STAS domain-containing protein [Polaromonas sp.]|nr:STAS domain-containing protein [Polaromonas sp.]